jgi:hypothetical protein
MLRRLRQRPRNVTTVLVTEHLGVALRPPLAAAERIDASMGAPAE